MRIREVLVRFYKSFNYDYELKFTPGAKPQGWQSTPDGWLPHVRINLESDITAIVGANESGKSHLLDAIHLVLTGERHRQQDFCRYSTLFSVETGLRLYPEVGAVLELNDSERAVIASSDIPLRGNGDLLMLRPEDGSVQVLNADDKRIDLTPPQAAALQGVLPYAFELNTQIDLPDSVSLAPLAGTKAVARNRQKRLEILAFLAGLETVEALTQQAAVLFKLISAAEARASRTREARLVEEQQELGRILLTKIARIDQSAFADLVEAIAGEHEGLVNALIQEMNKSIARHLNIAKWWSQDEDFQLRVSPREHELVFTIRDRTATEYSFSERSRGLTFFLSYYVQLLAHDRPTDRPEVLLMDEPDAYLSAVGQQDLLRVLEHHAHPEDSARSDQVVYVTHSPFLINRNAGHRVRVVDKGAGDEGTRLVKDATQNHYEPLRTSLGSFIAETAFIGGDNLFVEGISDQVLIAGMNARLKRSGSAPSATLDLNQVTLVPGGSNMPYMLYLARGRDQYKPACAVLLDSDEAGLQARKQIRRGGAKGRPTVNDDLIVMLGDLVNQPQSLVEPPDHVGLPSGLESAASNGGVTVTEGVTLEEPEDLVPLCLAGVSARRYASHLLGITAAEAAALTDEAIAAHIGSGNYSMWDAVEAAFRDAFDTEIGKAGFAKELVAFLDEHEGDSVQPDGAATLVLNFSLLIAKLSATLALAREREYEQRRDRRVERIIIEFLDAHPDGCLRDQATVMMRRLSAAADDTRTGDDIRARIATLRRAHELDSDPLERVMEYSKFREGLRGIPHMEKLRDQGVFNDADIDRTSNLEEADSPEQPFGLPHVRDAEFGPEAAMELGRWPMDDEVPPEVGESNVPPDSAGIEPAGPSADL